MKSSTSKSKPFQSQNPRLSQAGRTAESRSKLKQPFSTDSDAELFMYLIRVIRFVRRLNRALEYHLSYDKYDVILSRKEMYFTCC